MKSNVLFAFLFSCFSLFSEAQPRFIDTSLQLGRVAHGAQIAFDVQVYNPDTGEYLLRLEHICGCTEFSTTKYNIKGGEVLNIPIKYNSSGNKDTVKRGFYIHYLGKGNLGKQKIHFSAIVDTANQYNKPILHGGTCFSFDRVEINIGNILEGQPYSFYYNLNNCSKTPLTIHRVNSSCGCVTPSWNNKPILSGESTTISALFNTTGREGTFQKTLTVFLDDGTKDGAYVMLFLKGVVVTKEMYTRK